MQRDAYGRPVGADGQMVDHGQPLQADPTWTGVKRHGRKCHDLLFLILFLGCVAAYVVVTSMAFERGHPQWLDNTDTTTNHHLSGAMDRSMAHLKAQWRELLGATAVAIVLAIVWVQLLRWLTLFFIWATLFLGLALLLVVSCYLTFVLAPEQGNHFFTILGIVGLVLFVVLFLVCLGLRSKIKLTSVMVKEACAGLDHHPTLFLWTVFVLMVFLAFCAYWIYSLMYLYTVPADEKPLKHTVYFCVFSFFWISFVLSGILQMTIAGSIASWYFSRSVGQNDGGFSPSRAFFHACTYSLGSIAFATLLVAFTQFINWLLNRVRKQTHNKILRFFIACIQCCLGCIQKLVEYVNKFSFVYMAMYGDAFCTATKNVFHLMKRSGFSLVVIDLISDFLIFVGKVFGAAASTLLTLAILHAKGKTISSITVMCVIVISFLVFHIVGHIIAVGVDACAVCYLEDLERHGVEQDCYMTPKHHIELQTYHEERTSLKDRPLLNS